MFAKVYCFSYTLKQLIKLRQHEEKFMRRLIDGLEDYCAQISEYLLAKRNPSRLCREVYRQIDPILKEEQPANISCRAGCAHCCKQFVAVTNSEAKHLFQIAKANEIPLDIERLTQQQAWTDDDFLGKPAEQRACVFLDPTTQRCRVYNDRPFACRKYFVVTDPAMCDLESGERALIWYQIDAEILQTSWMTVDGAGGLPELLLKEIHNEQIPHG